ncbi:MAG: pentapeptide repeat-containing protein [Alphaproteobacteria bacterium]|nr:pentapeptide repeat-containing protein [Alphaproteobacteria bacterium]
MLRFAPALFIVAALAASEAAPPAPGVDSIKAGNHDCPHCMLAGADLTNQCVKNGDLRGADFDSARLVLMCMSYSNFEGATFRQADLSGANLSHSRLAGADFTGADLTATSLKGTDLTLTRGLSQRQLDKACGDADTKAPRGLSVPICN